MNKELKERQGVHVDAIIYCSNTENRTLTDLHLEFFSQITIQRI